ncbi:sulfur covalently-binding protein [Oryzomicrobium terrae]|uniref:Sulfur covalently-binding protein n=1 Tax=Oryzomicrobium terrae TaxID=1735038 RepID=A0A5C1E7G6_9RHOO|nr:sulfur covalently-binding protein [Oryzomicrobium terrae]
MSMNEMNARRDAMKKMGGMGFLGLLAAAGMITPQMALAAWNKGAFEAKTLADTLKALGAGTPVESKDVVLNAPDIAENGAVVPVSVTSNLPKSQQVAILVEKNPNALTAQFTIPEGTEASITTRVKMGQTSDVYALVKSDGKFYIAKKEIKVTLGGCGG